MTDSRAQLIDAFLAQEGWGASRREELAGDASSRRYERLRGGPGGRSAVLMDAPAAGDSVLAFQRIARHLTGLGLSAPEIYAARPEDGLLLLEDFGEALFPRILSTDREAERRLYLAATDVLVTLQAARPPAAPLYDAKAMAEAVGLAHDWYGLGATGQSDEAGKAEVRARLAEALAALPPWQPVLALRDYHAENLFWLPERSGPARVGLIDFQDAVLTHPAYDLISLAYDLRREVSPTTVEAMFSHFARATALSRESLDLAGAVLTTQRNLRILGVFARLSLHFGKESYAERLPRVWEILQNALAHPSLSPLAAAINASLPIPTPDIVSTLKEKCRTHPAL